jgi:hypothetical protein
MPFALLFCNLILADQTCNGNFFCYHSPEILKHSLYYDVFFLRAGLANQLVVSHWFSELLIPILFFSLMFLLKDVKRAFLLAGFYPFWHELQWTIVQHAYAKSTYAFGEYVWIGLAVAMSCIAIYACKEILFTKTFLILNFLNFGFLACWVYFDDMNVTVFGLGKQAAISIYYYQFETNFFEVGDWFVVFMIIFVSCTYFIYRKRSLRLSVMR